MAGRTTSVVGQGRGHQPADDHRGQGPLTSALLLVEKAIGMNPRLATRAVIRTGRIRVRAPWSTALARVLAFLSALQNVGDQHQSA